jgi:plastocyanin
MTRVLPRTHPLSRCAPALASRAPRPHAAVAALVIGAAAALPAAAGSVTVQVSGADGRPLADAVVFVESPAARAAVRPQPASEIAQLGQEFVPRVSVVTLGSAVAFPNRDKVRHHVYSFSPTKTFELKLYAGTPANPVVFDRSGVAVLGCNIHDHMSAWVLVLETPYHARSGADGVARLSGVPDGAYQLRAWHADLPPGAPATSQPLQLAGGADAAARVRLGGPAR